MLRGSDYVGITKSETDFLKLFFRPATSERVAPHCFFPVSTGFLTDVTTLDPLATKRPFEFLLCLANFFIRHRQYSQLGYSIRPSKLKVVSNRKLREPYSHRLLSSTFHERVVTQFGIGPIIDLHARV